MKNKLFRKILICMVITLTVCMGLMIFVMNNNFVSIEIDQLSKQSSLIARGIEEYGEDYLNSIEDDDYRITWINSNGDVLYDSEVNASSMENHSSREEFKQALSEGEGSSIRYSSTVLQQNIYYATKISDGTVVRVAETYDTVLFLTLRLATPILWIYIIAIVISGLLANHLAKKISSPINKIDLDNPLEADNYEEIQPLLNRIDSQNKQIHKQIEDLHQKKKEFETVSNNITEGLILFNINNEIISYNHAAVQLLQCEDITTLKDDSNIQALLQSSKEGNEEERIIHKDEAIIRLIANPIYSRKQFTGTSILVFDVTETYEAEQQRKEFTANVSHELKTPLQSIMGSSELLENHLVKKEDIDTFYQKIHQDSARMLTLIDDIIRLSQLDEAGEVEETNLHLNDSATEAIRSLKESANKKNITITTQLDDVVTHANNRLVYEIIYNLLDNAIRYSNENTNIIIKTYGEKNTSNVQIIDHGIGIPLEDQSRIFERFYRVDKSHSRATGGTGLGLSIVKHAVKKCHGTIKLESEVNKGSTFTVSFPKA